MTKLFKKVVCLISATLLTLSIAACGGNQAHNTGGATVQGNALGYEETELGTDSGLLSPATAEIDPKGNLVVYDRGQISPAYVFLDKDGKKVGEVKCDFAGDGSIFTVGPDGIVYIVAMVGGNRETSMSYKYLVYDLNGKKLAETDLGSVSRNMEKGPGSGFSAIAADKDGNAYIANSQTGISVYGKDGTKIKDLPVQNAVSLDFDKDGNLVVSGFTMGKITIEKINPSNGSSIWNQNITANSIRMTPTFGRIRCSAADGSIFRLGDSQIDRFDASGKKQEPVLRFMDYSIMASGYEVSDFVVSPTGGFYVITSSQGPGGFKMMKGGAPKGASGEVSGNVSGNAPIGGTDGAPANAEAPTANAEAPTSNADATNNESVNSPVGAPDNASLNGPDGAPAGYAIYRYDPASGKSADSKSVIKLTISRSDRYIETAIGKFQKANPDYRIELTYYEDESGTDQDNVIKNLNTSILSGSGPDIISVNNLPFQKYAEKNILADLEQFIKNDKSFDLSKYYGNIIDAVRTNGSLYAMPISYGFSALMANKGILDQNQISLDDTKWTWNDFQAIAQKIDKNGGGIKALPQMTYNDLLSTVMSGNYSKFVDPVKKTSTLDSQEFYDILNMIKSFGDVNSTIKGGKGMLADEAVNRGAVAFMPWQIGDYVFYGMLTSMAGGSIEMLNYPSAGGSSKYAFSCNRDRIFSINANSKYTEQAWEFIKLLLSDEMQSSMELNGFAVNKVGLEANAKQAISVTTNGNVMMNINGTEIKPAPLTQEGINTINGFIGKLNSFTNYDAQIVSIAQDELKAFFEGDKTAEEVCKLIQGRVNTYLGE